MSQSLVQCLQALGNIVFISCAIRSRDEDGRPVCLRSCFFSQFGEICSRVPFT